MQIQSAVHWPARGGPMRGIGEMNIAKIAGFCEQKFGEWGH